jgi:hypothetical protein
MTSKNTFQLLTGPWSVSSAAVLGYRIRWQQKVNEAVLTRAERFQQVEANL